MIKSLPCAVMLSGYPSELYEWALPDWHSLSLLVMNPAGVVTEKVWLNFTPGRLHWHLFAGKEFTHRLCTKRKARDWTQHDGRWSRASGWRCCPP